MQSLPNTGQTNAMGHSSGACPDYGTTRFLTLVRCFLNPRNQSVHIRERQEGEITHFITLTFWDSLDAIRGFAGEDVERAKYYPEDSDFLLEFEPKVVHYEVVGQSRSE